MTQLENIQLPDRIVERLRQLATNHGRDLTSELSSVLERGLREAESIENELVEVRALRAAMPNVWLTDEKIRAARDEGRA